MPELIYRSFLIERASVDASAQSVDASLSSEAPVERYPGEIEVLSHEQGAVDLTRAKDGLPLLFAHDHREPIGLVESVRLEAKRLVGRLRFGASQRAKELFADVQSGVLKNISIGYRSIDTEDIPGGVLITSWEIYEASIVGVPLDASVGVGRSFTPGNSNPHIGERNMNTETEDKNATTAQPENLSNRARVERLYGLVHRPASYAVTCHRMQCSACCCTAGKPWALMARVCLPVPGNRSHGRHLTRFGGFFMPVKRPSKTRSKATIEHWQYLGKGMLRLAQRRVEISDKRHDADIRILMAQ